MVANRRGSFSRSRFKCLCEKQRRTIVWFGGVYLQHAIRAACRRHISLTSTPPVHGTQTSGSCRAGAMRVKDRLDEARARSSAGEHLPDTEGVTGSIPVAPTTFFVRWSPNSGQVAKRECRPSAGLSAFHAARPIVSTYRLNKETGTSMLSEPWWDIEKLGGDHKTRRTAAITSLKFGFCLLYQAAGWGRTAVLVAASM